jgi:hypothetical protein
VRGTQVAHAWAGALMLAGKDVHAACRLLGARSQQHCDTLSRRLLVVHLKDLSPRLFAALPLAAHVLDPIDKIYSGWGQPTDPRLCGLLVHSQVRALRGRTRV